MTYSICTIHSFQSLFLYVISSFFTTKLSKMVMRGIVIEFIGEEAKALKISVINISLCW